MTRRCFFIQKIFLLPAVFICLLTCCRKNQFNDIKEIDSSAVTHTWYYLTDYSFEKTEGPQFSPAVLQKPWTEAVRISSAAIVPDNQKSGEFEAYALVNKTGLLAFRENGIQLYCDATLFTDETADGLVFSNGCPVFYFYRSTFFNEGILSSSAHLKKAEQITVKPSRTFLAQFKPNAKLCYPLVSYTNLNLMDEDQITGYYWNGKNWNCSVKKIEEGKVEFSYFSWEPLVSLTDLSPALNSSQFTFEQLSEASYRALNTPKLFSEAPEEIKLLFRTLPSSLPVYVTWRGNEGISPVRYYQEGDGSTPLNAYAVLAKKSGYTAALFADGTTYLMLNKEDNRLTAFRLPKLPAGYSYGEIAIAGNTLYAAWEQKSFYKTGRSGFLSVNLQQVLSKF